MDKNKIYAVLTGDLINSSKLTVKQRQKLIDEINKEFNAPTKVKDFDLSGIYFYRGDSFQIALDKPEHALKVALGLKAFIQKNNPHKTEKIDARIAVGIGPIESLNETISKSDGTAFQLSGRAIDKMKNNDQTIIIRFEKDELNKEFKVYCNLLDALISRWTKSVAATLNFLLMGLKEKEIAKILAISQPAINSRKKSAQWDSIEALLDRFTYIVKNKIK